MLSRLGDAFGLASSPTSKSGHKRNKSSKQPSKQQTKQKNKPRSGSDQQRGRQRRADLKPAAAQSGNAAFRDAPFVVPDDDTEAEQSVNQGDNFSWIRNNARSPADELKTDLSQHRMHRLFLRGEFPIDTGRSEWDELLRNYPVADVRADPGVPAAFGAAEHDDDALSYSTDGENASSNGSHAGLDGEEPTYLPKDEVAKVIDECVEKYKAEWACFKQPIFNAEALKVWRSSRGEPAWHHAVVVADQRQLRKFEATFKKTRDSLLDDQWLAESVLRRVCPALEVTTHNILEYEHRLAVHALDEEPTMANLPSAAAAGVGGHEASRIIDMAEHSTDAESTGNSDVDMADEAAVAPDLSLPIRSRDTSSTRAAAAPDTQSHVVLATAALNTQAELAPDTQAEATYDALIEDAPDMSMGDAPNMATEDTHVEPGPFDAMLQTLREQGHHNSAVPPLIGLLDNKRRTSVTDLLCLYKKDDLTKLMKLWIGAYCERDNTPVMLPWDEAIAMLCALFLCHISGSRKFVMKPVEKPTELLLQAVLGALDEFAEGFFGVVGGALA